MVEQVTCDEDRQTDWEDKCSIEKTRRGKTGELKEVPSQQAKAFMSALIKSKEEVRTFIAEAQTTRPADHPLSSCM